MTIDAPAPKGLRWVDSHCHLGFEGEDDAEVDAAVEVARAAGVTRMVTIGTDEASSARALRHAGRLEGVWATVGLHPHEASSGVAPIVDLVESRPPGLVAVGECGLDYYYEHSHRKHQQEAFAAQIALADQHELALVVHTRDAWEDTFAILSEVGVPSRLVIHCFSGGPQEAQKCLELGAYLSFSGIVTFKNAEPVREAAHLCPLERLLVETDSPFLAPVPHRGRPNQPAWVALVGEAVAALKGVPAAEVAQAASANAERVFGLGEEKLDAWR